MVSRWDIITIGNLSRNRYWGESDERAVRPTLCTCTLIRADGFRLLVDPSVEDAARMTAELDRRSGLKVSDINLVFITHAHGDHHFGLRHFAKARWLAAAGVAREINASGQYDQMVEPVSGQIERCIDVLPTPGHTADHHSLRFDCDGFAVTVAGDAVMTRDHWRERRGHFNSLDPAQASQTVELLAQGSDVIVPGHDNCFLTGREK